MQIIKRIFYEQLLTSLEKDVITALIGPRQTGKTTALNYIQKHLSERGVSEKNILFLTFDDFSIREKSNLNDYLKLEIASVRGKNIEQLVEKFYLIIDEAQKQPRIFDQLKILYDNFRNIKIIISGSSSLNILDRTAESLAGRINFIKVNPFTIMETLVLLGNYDLCYDDFNFVPLLIKGKLTESKIKEFDEKYLFFRNVYERNFENFLLTGLMPRTVHEKVTEEKMRLINDYKNTYVDRDIRLIKGIGDLMDFNKLLTIISARITSTYEISSLSKKAGMDCRTVKKYISILENTFIIYRLNPYLTNVEKRVVKSPKLYFFDNGIVSLLMDIRTFKGLEVMEEKGAFYENLIIGNIKKYMDNERAPVNVYYYRTYQGAEVDMVLAGEDGLLLFEIKSGKEVKKSMLTGFKSIKEEMREKINSCYIIYEGPFRKLGENIFCLPAYLFI